jgi:hypothetical protein
MLITCHVITVNIKLNELPRDTRIPKDHNFLKCHFFLAYIRRGSPQQLDTTTVNNLTKNELIVIYCYESVSVKYNFNVSPYRMLCG